MPEKKAEQAQRKQSGTLKRQPQRMSGLALISYFISPYCKMSKIYNEET